MTVTIGEHPSSWGDLMRVESLDDVLSVSMHQWEVSWVSLRLLSVLVTLSYLVYTPNMPSINIRKIVHLQAIPSTSFLLHHYILLICFNQYGIERLKSIQQHPLLLYHRCICPHEHCCSFACSCDSNAAMRLVNVIIASFNSSNCAE